MIFFSFVITGSLLVGRTSEDCSVLRKKVEQFVDAGLGAEFLSSDDLLAREPALKLGEESGAAFMPDDCQLDARRTVAFIEKVPSNLYILLREVVYFYLILKLCYRYSYRWYYIRLTGILQQKGDMLTSIMSQ